MAQHNFIGTLLQTTDISPEIPVWFSNHLPFIASIWFSWFFPTFLIGFSSVWQGRKWLCFKLRNQIGHVKSGIKLDWWWTRRNGDGGGYWWRWTNLLRRILCHDDSQLNWLMFDSSTIFICSYLVNWNVNKRTPFATKCCKMNGVFSATIKNDFLEEIFDRLKVKRRNLLAWTICSASEIYGNKTPFTCPSS